MTTFITLPWKLERSPPAFEGNDIKFPESLVRHLLKTYAKKGDKIFDPFAGLGTTLFVAEEMGCVPYGIEAERQKYEWVAGQMEHWMNLFHADAYSAPTLPLPKMDLILTSPPFMPNTHKWNPLFGGDPTHAGYDKYLRRMGKIFERLMPLMKKGAPLILHLDNIKQGKNFTPLIRDIAQTLDKNFIQSDEVKILWKTPKADYPYTQYLIFKKK